MNAMYLGEVVRRQRNALGVPQEMVCEGLCTAMTLSRFESGRQSPSRDCVVAILQRLGLQDDWYYAQLTREETKMIRLRKDVSAYCNQFEQTSGDERRQIRIIALKKLHDLERYIKKDDHISQQFILGIKVTLESYSPQKQLEILMDAIRLTSPRFNLDELGSCLYCTEEVSIISQIAIRHSRCGQRKKAIDIYEQLLKLVQKRTPNHIYLPLLTYNYARYLALENRFDEALKISELGRKACIKQGNYCMFPGFFHIEAECYYMLGELHRSEELYPSAYYIYAATINTKYQEDLKADAKERFNLSL